MMRCRGLSAWLFVLGAWLACLWLPLPAGAEPPTPATLDALLGQLASHEGIDESLRDRAAARVSEAKNWLSEAERLREATAALQKEIRAGSGGVEKLRREAEKLRREPAPDLKQLERLPQNRLEARMAEAQLELQRARQALAEAERTLSDLIAAATQGGEEIATTRRQLDETRSTLAGLDQGHVDPRLLPIEKAWLQAREAWLAARLDYLTLRQGNLALLTDRAQARRDLLAARLETIQKRVDALREALQTIRRTAAARETEQAQTAVEEAPPELRRLQQEITRLLEEKQRVVAEETEASERLEAKRALLDELRSDRKRITHLVSLGGRGETLSALLQKRLSALPSLEQLRQEDLEIQKRLNAAVMRQLELDERLRRNRNLDAALEQLLATVDAQADPARLHRLRAAARRLLDERRDTLMDLLKTYTRYISRLSELDADLRQLLDLVADYRRYLNEQLLWMPSARLLPLPDPLTLLQGIRWHLAPSTLATAGRDLARAVKQRPDLALLYLAIALGTLAARPRLRDHLDRLGDRTRSLRSDRWIASPIALVESLLLALPLPAVLLGTARLLHHLESASATSRILGDGLNAAGQLLLALALLRVLCREKGLAPRHLRWSPTFCRQLRQELVWFLPLATVLAYLTGTGGSGEGRPAEVLMLGRLAFLALLVAIMLLVWRLGRLRAPALQELARRRHPGPWLRYHALWFPLALLVPAGLIAASLVGYYYSALYLAERLHLTLWSILALHVARDLLLRALTLTQRRLRLEEALRKREERRLAGESEPADAAAQGDNLVVEEPEPDIGQLSAQVRQLVQTGYLIGLFLVVWLIWSDVVPALRFLDAVTLPITTSKQVNGVLQDVPMTLGDLLSGLLLAAFTLLVARNLPAVLELTLLQRLPVSRGAAYAIKAVSQYTVALLGVLLIFNSLGLQWSSVQWLVAALGVGLGFGLQEIVANFISGLILLFEQPIRVGDVVTVEGITGTVTRIRIRATTIVNWDRQELVIPNKSFITGQLINWTLSDTVNRVIITVGIAYGSDVERALALLEEAAREHPLVLDDPPPRVTFEEFGDNALTLRLRAYLDNLDYRLTLITDLHRMINKKYAEAGIEIAFPQRDLHLDTRRPLEIVLREEAKGS